MQNKLAYTILGKYIDYFYLLISVTYIHFRFYSFSETSDMIALNFSIDADKYFTYLEQLNTLCEFFMNPKFLYSASTDSE